MRMIFHIRNYPGSDLLVFGSEVLAGEDDVNPGIPAGTLCRLGAYHELFDDGDPGDQSEETDHRCFFDDSDSGTGSTNGQNPA